MFDELKEALKQYAIGAVIHWKGRQALIIKGRDGEKDIQYLDRVPRTSFDGRNTVRTANGHSAQEM
jgi:hypothetical protein